MYAYVVLQSVFSRYTAADGMEPGPNQSTSHRPDIESGQVTLYIPKVKKDDGGKTLIRRRRTSSKKRSSSKRKQDRENLSDLLYDEDNHLLPSLRIQRRTRMKSLKGINPLYAGGLFHCYMLDMSICNFRGVRSILSLIFYF